MKHEKSSACRFERSVRQINQTGQAIRIIRDNLLHYKNKELSVEETSMPSRGEK
jgi:hypothetical protein